MTGTGDGAKDAPMLSCANAGTVEADTDAARGAADIVSIELGLFAIAHVIHGFLIFFQCVCNYSIYACAVTIHLSYALPSSCLPLGLTC